MGGVRPDVLLLDLVIPDVPDPPALVAQLRERQPGLRVVMMSSLQSGELEHAAAAARADGHLHKATTGPALCDLLVRVARRPQAHAGG
jgi:DNA-binding NarL/FixJ family response regulator